MNAKTIMLALCLGLPTLAAHAGDASGSLVYIGTRGSPKAATGPQGIYGARLDTHTGKLSPLGLQIELPAIS
jgi:hypothetical protein